MGFQIEVVPYECRTCGRNVTEDDLIQMPMKSEREAVTARICPLCQEQKEVNEAMRKALSTAALVVLTSLPAVAWAKGPVVSVADTELLRNLSHAMYSVIHFLL